MSSWSYYDGCGFYGARATAENNAPAGSASYVVQEEDGTSKLTLEEGGGSLLTEEST